MALIKCPECEHRVSDHAPYCPNCGNPIASQQEQEPHQDSMAVHQEQETFEPTHGNKKSHKKAISIIAILVVIAISVVVISQYALFGINKIAYDLIVKNTHNFKNPTSVRVISGTAGDFSDVEEIDDRDYAYVCLTSTNSYGAYVTGYYNLDEDYCFDLSDYPSQLSDSIEWCKDDDLNVRVINRRLALHFGK